jgi:hypothetical protein
MINEPNSVAVAAVLAAAGIAVPAVAQAKATVNWDTR